MSQPRRKGDGDMNKARKTAMDIPSLKAHLLSKLHKSNKSGSTEIFSNLVT